MFNEIPKAPVSKGSKKIAFWPCACLRRTRYKQYVKARLPTPPTPRWLSEPLASRVTQPWSPNLPARCPLYCGFAVQGVGLAENKMTALTCLPPISYNPHPSKCPMLTVTPSNDEHKIRSVAELLRTVESTQNRRRWDKFPPLYSPQC